MPRYNIYGEYSAQSHSISRVIEAPNEEAAIQVFCVWAAEEHPVEWFYMGRHNVHSNGEVKDQEKESTMKFSVNKSSDYPEVKAYLSQFGCLVIFDNLNGMAMMISEDGNIEDCDWAPDEAETRFYPGDSVVITF